MIIDIREVERLEERRRQINSIPLEDIVWVKDGEPVPVTTEQLEHFKYTGLNNINFVTMGFCEGIDDDGSN